MFLVNLRDRVHRFNWQILITIPLNDGTTRNLLTHYGQVTIDNAHAHAATYIGTQTRTTQDNDMFYYFLAGSLTPAFRAKLLLYASLYMVNGVTTTSIMLKQIIVLSRIDNAAAAQHI